MARRRVIITTPYPSMEEIAKTHRIPRKELKAVIAMVEEMLARPHYRRLVKQYRQRHPNHGKSA